LGDLEHLLAVPAAEHFAVVISQHESEHQVSDNVYLTSLHEFRKVELGSFGEYEAYSVLCLYLLKWGNMSRVLGYRGCKALGKKLGEIENKFYEFKPFNLPTVSLDRISPKIESIYNSVMDAQWVSDRGRTKRVGPTATAKVLHLVVPDLFMIWDRRIRDVYGFGESSEEYVRFLENMQNWMKSLDGTVEMLRERYGKPSTKIVDAYNWKTCWG
jgi:hypothetical protein